MTLNITWCLFLVEKTEKINTSMSSAPKQALGPASRYYCDVNWSYLNVCVLSFIRIEKVKMGAHDFK